MTETKSTEIDPTKQPVKYAVMNEDVKTLCKAEFGIDLYPTQEKIVRDIVFEKERRIILNCYTQYGKTLAIGVGLALYIRLNSKKDLNIGLLGPAKSDARSIRDDMLKYGLNNELFRELIDTSKGGDPDDMLKSASKDEVTFTHRECGSCGCFFKDAWEECRNPECEDGTEDQTVVVGQIKVECMSASSGGSGDGEGLMGDGVDFLVMDESNRIGHDTWKDSTDRLLNSFDSVLIEAGNPKHQENQFYEHWTSKRFKKYHVGEYSLEKYDSPIPGNCETSSGLEEGRHTEAFFDEKASNVNGRDSVRFSWKYKSIFPDQVEDGLINKAWIREAQEKEFDLEDPNVVYGIDVAGEGKDLIVLTRLEQEGAKYVLTDQWSRETSNDERVTARWASNHVREEPESVERFVVDALGIGNGLHSRLDDRGFNAVKFKAGEKPKSEEGEYENKKARNFFILRQTLMDGDLGFRDGWRNNQLDMPSNKLVYQLGHMKREPGRRNTDRVVDPENKSPDFADSLMMCFFEGSTAFVM